MTSAKESKNELSVFNQKIDEFTSGISSFINSLDEIPGYSVKAMAAESICFEAVNYGSINAYEAVGILECAKRRYLEIFEEVSAEGDEDLEFDEDEDEDEDNKIEGTKNSNLH